MAIMTPEHREWQAFRDELARFTPRPAAGDSCAYCYPPERPPDAKQRPTDPCRVRRALLEAYGADVEASLGFSRQQGEQTGCPILS